MRKMTEALRGVLASWGLIPPKAQQDSHARHLLVVLDEGASRIVVGSVYQDRGEFVFRYSDEFKAQTKIPPLAAFPALDEEYRSEQLWPFFAVRMPPLDRPD